VALMQTRSRTLVAGYFAVLHLLGPKREPMAEQTSFADAEANVRAFVEGIPISGVLKVGGEWAIVSEGKVVQVGHLVEAKLGITLLAVEHSAVVDGPPARPVVWFKSRTGHRFSRELTTQVLLR
jgi:hypothetical protein